jgi:hypothetical protein
VSNGKFSPPLVHANPVLDVLKLHHPRSIDVGLQDYGPWARAKVVTRLACCSIV